MSEQVQAGVTDADRPALPGLWRVVGLFMRIVNTTFGGGAPTIAVLGREMSRRKWAEQTDFEHFYTIAKLTPGTNLLAFCTAVGWHFRHWKGALAVLLVSSLPSSILVTLLISTYSRWSATPWVMTALKGASAAIVGVMFAASWHIVRPYFVRSKALRFACLALGAIVAASFGLSPIAILGIAAVVGFFWTDPEK